VRATTFPDPGPGGSRRAIERLDALPMRPASARQVLASLADDEDPAAPSPSGPTPLPPSTETDPAWALELSRAVATPVDALGTLAGHRWWPSSPSTGPVPEALARLWRLSAAVAFGSRRLAREAGDPDPEAVGRAGLLHALGLWGLAAVEPEAVAAWFAAPDPARRLDLERSRLGTEAANLGRILAVRWGCEPLVVDAAWLHADLDGDLNGCSGEPGRLALIQRAHAMARMTPWAPGAPEAREVGPIDPRARILTAEVQSRCVGPFVEADATAREERLTRENARLRQSVGRLRADRGSEDRLVRAMAGSSPTEGPEAWADRAGLAWCGEPGVASARVVWAGREVPEADPAGPTIPTDVLPLGDPARPCALVYLRRTVERVGAPGGPSTLAAWDAWARLVDERDRLGRLLDDVVSAHRGRVAREGPDRRRAMLEALAEFAGGAGHELNNPLAVIMGRAQLLMAREVDPGSVRSLRAIIAQAQRAHRILRDLMYIARPPEPRPRPCLPEEIVRACLVDLRDEADVRGVRIASDPVEPRPRVWADPDPLRQVADILARNALEATPGGGLVRFIAGRDGRTIRWAVHDGGRGIAEAEGRHLFDPFYCGRQAGRGLGLGLPRAARIVDQAGGEIRWQSVPGHGTTFHVSFPAVEIPELEETDRPGVPKVDRALPAR